MIGQRISLPILVPRAIAVLRATPFVDCGLYDGVLLATVLRLDGNFWKSQPGLRRDALEIAKRVKGVLSVQAAPIEQEVMESVEAFLLGHREWATVVRCQREIKEGEELLVAKVTFPVCPVCGYEQDRPPWNGASASDEICPCCGIQFGYDDWAGGDASGRPEIYKEWQRRWIEGGMKWWSKGRIRPTGWDRHEQLRRVNQEKYGGMTTNERLFAAGLLDQFDRAARSRNRQEMVLLLTQVEFAVSEAEKITDTILADPKMYGF
jgi:hypothetical protein